MQRVASRRGLFLDHPRRLDFTNVLPTWLFDVDGKLVKSVSNSIIGAHRTVHQNNPEAKAVTFVGVGY